MEEIAKRYDPQLDGPLPIPDRQFSWRWPRSIRMVKRRLTEDQVANAQKYINCIIRRDYPFQVREMMGRQLWLEFCEYWAVNPDFDKAIRYL